MSTDMVQQEKLYINETWQLWDEIPTDLIFSRAFLAFSGSGFSCREEKEGRGREGEEEEGEMGRKGGVKREGQNGIQEVCMQMFRDN